MTAHVDLSEFSPEELAEYLQRRHDKRCGWLDTMKQSESYKICQMMLADARLQPGSSPPRTPRHFEEFSKRRWEGACRRFRMRMKEWVSHYHEITKAEDEKTDTASLGFSPCSLS